jgi:hypothetical protein
MVPRWCAIGLAFLMLQLPGVAATQPASAPPVPGLSLETVIVEPGVARADTLCRLRVRIRNTGAQAASHLRFQVQVAGHDLVAYRNLVYLQTLPPAATAEVQLRNFWSSESGRPFPAQGEFAVRVTLVEAQWVLRRAHDGATMTEPTGAVAGLPVTVSATLPRP